MTLLRKKPKPWGILLVNNKVFSYANLITTKKYHTEVIFFI